MATLRDIKKRIVSVKNTQKITKAMKMVAAAKLRRAQMAVIGSRPFSEKLKNVTLDIISKSKDKDKNPLYVGRKDVKKVVVMIYTSNRGLCGGFNSNLLRKTHHFISDLKNQGKQVHIFVIGRKGKDFLVSRGHKIDEQNIAWAESLSFKDAVELTQKNLDKFHNHEFDEYYLAYNQFKSAISQEVMIEKLLPLTLEEKLSHYGIDYIYEPAKEEILTTLLPKYLATQIYKAHLESLASELGSRMTAMENATNNASDMIGSLTLQYNRARQAAITTELMDIVNGAEAIK